MRSFSAETGIAAPLLQANINTDAIIPSHEMKRVSKKGLGEGLFASWRYRYEKNRRTGLREEFVLNRAPYDRASIILAGPNFGCGSSREHAVWALVDFGIRAVVAPSFGAIFKRNCFRNGLLPVELSESDLRALADIVRASPEKNTVSIDLEARTLRAPGFGLREFVIDESARHRLLAGTDEIDLTLQHQADIVAFRQARVAAEPWVTINQDKFLPKERN